jgi:hypothetical protein
VRWLPLPVRSFCLFTAARCRQSERSLRSEESLSLYVAGRLRGSELQQWQTGFSPLRNPLRFKN